MIRIRNRRRSPRNLFNTSELIGSWPLEEPGGIREDVNQGKHKFDLQDINTVGTSTGVSRASLFEHSALRFLSTGGGFFRPTGPFTIACWFRREADHGQTESIISRWSTGGQNQFILAVNSSDTLVFAVSTNGTDLSALCASTSTISLNQWYHIVVQFQPGLSSRLYIDGVFDDGDTSLAPTTTFHTSNRDFAIGQTNIPVSVTNGITGKVCDVYLAQDNLTDGGVAEGETAEGEVAELYNNGLRLSYQDMSHNLRMKLQGGGAFFPLSDAFEPRHDLVTKGEMSLTNTNGVTWEEGPPTGKVCADFVDTNSESLSHADVGDLLDIPTDQTFTLTAWCKRDSSLDDHFYIMSKLDTGVVNGFVFRMDKADYTLFATVNNSAQTVWGDFVGDSPTDKWNFLSAGFDGNRIWLKSNGLPRDVMFTAQTNGPNVNTGEFLVGIDFDTVEFCLGQLAHLSYFRRELSDEELDEIYNFGMPNPYPYNSTPTINAC